MDRVAKCGSDILGTAGKFRGGWQKMGVEFFPYFPLSNTYKENQYSLFEFRRYLVVLSLVKDKHFQEQDNMEIQKAFLYSSVELYCSRMFLHMGSGELSSSLFWCTIDETQKRGEG